MLSTELKDNWGEMRGKIVSDEDFDVLFRQLADVNKKNLEVSSLLFLGKTIYFTKSKVKNRYLLSIFIPTYLWFYLSKTMLR